MFFAVRKNFFAYLAFAFCSTIYAAEPSILHLTLDESILLGVRENPNVQSSKLSLVSQKFNTWIQQWAFYPHYSFQANAAATSAASAGQPTINSQNLNIQPSVSLLTPIGTQAKLSYGNVQSRHYNPSLSLEVMQPLLRGFGTAVVEAALDNAKDSEKISRLNVEGVLRTTVTTIISAYLDVVSAQKRIVIAEGALQRAEKSVEQTKLYIKAGHKAGNEVVTVQANAASARALLENERNNLAQARYALLTAIGLDPNTKVSFAALDIDNLIKKYHLPSVIETKRLILQNDIQFQTAEITLHGSTNRSLLIAEDNSRWQLNVNATASTGNGSGGGENAGINSLFNGVNQMQSIGLTLQVPIDDQTNKQAVMNAKIALKQAELALKQEKWNKETSAINGWNNVVSSERSLRFAADAEQLQEKTYNLSYQKYLHGLIDSLELQSALASLVNAQQTLLNARIAYLKALVGMDLLTGNTLKTWDIKVRL